MSAQGAAPLGAGGAPTGVYEDVDHTQRTAKVASACRGVLMSLPGAAPSDLRESLTRAVKLLERAETQIAVAGLFKAGKSTFLNRLLRHPILPHGDLPETGAPAWLSRGRQLSAAVVTRDGSRTEIPAEAAALAAHTSLYRDGVRRTSDELATRAEIVAPRLPLNASTTLIDLPGLSDTQDMDEVALDAAYQADAIIWLFRSEPTFGMQDADALSRIAAVCGSNVISVMMNVLSPSPSARAWTKYMREKAIVHRARVAKFAPEFGRDETLGDELMMIDARAFNNNWIGVTFGGRRLFKFFRANASKSGRMIKEARFARIKRNLAPLRTWSQVQVAAAEETLRQAKLEFDAYQRRLAAREALEAQAIATAEASLAGLASEIRAIGAAAAEEIRPGGYTPGKQVARPLISGAVLAIHARASKLSLDAAGLSSNPEAGELSDEGLAAVRAAFALDTRRGERPEASIERSISDAVGSIAMPSLDVSFRRIWSWVKGQDVAVADACEQLRRRVRESAEDLGKRLERRRKPVIEAFTAALTAPPIPPVPVPTTDAVDAARGLEMQIGAIELALTGPLASTTVQ